MSSLASRRERRCPYGRVGGVRHVNHCLADEGLRPRCHGIRVSTAVAAAAIDSGVSTIPLDLAEYAKSLKDMYTMKQGL
eukprot:8932110-Pyramimonas_sp.AAC.2